MFQATGGPGPRELGKGRWGIHGPEGAGRACWRTQNQPCPRGLRALWKRWADVLRRGKKSRNPMEPSREPRGQWESRTLRPAPPGMEHFFPAHACTLPATRALAGWKILGAMSPTQPSRLPPPLASSLSLEVPLSIAPPFLGRDGDHGLWGTCAHVSHRQNLPGGKKRRDRPLAKEGPSG